MGLTSKFPEKVDLFAELDSNGNNICVKFIGEVSEEVRDSQAVFASGVGVVSVPDAKNIISYVRESEIAKKENNSSRVYLRYRRATPESFFPL